MFLRWCTAGLLLLCCFWEMYWYQPKPAGARTLVEASGGAMPFLPPLKFPLVVPPAKDDYRGLLAEIDARCVLHFRQGEVAEVEVGEVSARSRFDPLPEILDLNRDARTWAKHTLRQWKSSRIDPFRLEVRLEFRTDPALGENEVVYRVEYGRNGPDSGAYHPERILILAAPGDVEGWKKRVEDFHRHEEKVRQMRRRL
jgi:hypothetical protein